MFERRRRRGRGRGEEVQNETILKRKLFQNVIRIGLLDLVCLLRVKEKKKKLSLRLITSIILYLFNEYNI